MNLEKPVKAEFLQNEKNWRYHHCHICTKNHNHMRYSSWDTEWDRIFCQFRPFFPFYPSPIPPNPENQNFESMIKAFGDVNILTSRNKKHDHMVYDYSDMECGRHFFCHFRPYFALLLHYWPRKLKFGKNIKKHLEILSFYICVS